jgi:hypothetical protein
MVEACLVVDLPDPVYATRLMVETSSVVELVVERGHVVVTRLMVNSCLMVITCMVAEAWLMV